MGSNERKCCEDGLGTICIDRVGGLYQSYYNDHLVEKMAQLGLEVQRKGFRRPKQAQQKAEISVSDHGGY